MKKIWADSVYTTLDAGGKEWRTMHLEITVERRSFRAGTGKILAMVSKPAYDPNTVLKNWQSLVRDDEEESKLVNRASQGLYPPGLRLRL